VVEVIPWIEHDGSRRFRCRLLLGPSAATGAEQAYDLLSQGPRVRRLLELGCMLSTSGFYRAPAWPCRHMHLASLERDRLVMSLDEPPPDSIPLPVHVQLGFELFSVSYEMQVWPLRRRGATLEVTLPLVMRRHRRRREQRAAVRGDDPIAVTFRNPVTGNDERRAVVDLSFGGLCFESQPPSDVLWPGIVLEDVALDARGETIAGGELEVRSIETGAGGRTLCHAANRHADRVDDWALVDLLGALRHPDVEMHDGSDFRGVMGLYRRAGLLAGFIDRNLDPVIERAAAHWHRLHESRAAIGRTFVSRQPGGALQAAVSAVRAWDRTWLAQHFASDSTGAGQITGALHLAYLDFVLPRPDAHYLAFFVKSDNATMNAFYERFSALAGTPEVVDKVGVDYWIHRAGTTPPMAVPSPYRRRRMEAGDHRVVARAAERTLGRLAAGSLSLEEQRIELPDTEQRFKRADLRRCREGHVITRDGRAVTSVLTEQTSPGINLTWMLNAAWLLPIHPDLDDGRATALALDGVLGAPPPVPNGDRFVITVPGVPTEPLLAAGFEKIATVYLYVFNRSGLRRYHQYVADRYGEVGAVVTRRRSERQARMSA